MCVCVCVCVYINNIKRRAKSIVTTSTLYIKLPYDKLKSKLSSIDDFAFKGGTKLLLDYLIMLQHTEGRKQKGVLYLVKHQLKQL